MIVTRDELENLIVTKLNKAGLKKEHANDVAKTLSFADSRGIHSHGAIRTEYYSERIAKGGINTTPKFSFNQTGESVGVFNGDNGMGHVAAKKSMDKAINVAKKTGVAVIGVKNISHSGTLSFYTQHAAEENLIGISTCQADPMAVPFGGSEPYYGTNPLSFSAPALNKEMIVFDMATTVKAWGKILEARSNEENIPNSWAVDRNGSPTTDPFKVRGLSPMSGAKGYGLAMMVDILSGILLGLPFGNRVSALYGNLSEGRDLGQLHIVINPEYFTDLERFKENVSITMSDLNKMKPAKGFEQVFYPGQRSMKKENESEKKGINLNEAVYDYLKSEVVHNNKYSNQTPFGD